MFGREETFYIKALDFLCDNYDNIEMQYSVNYFKIRVIVSGDEEFVMMNYFLSF